MATKKTGTRKTAGKTKPATKTPDIPAVVSDIRNIATGLRTLWGDIPEVTVAQRDKLATSIDKYADRVGKVLAGAGKTAEKEAAKAKREAAKKVRIAAKRVKAEKRIADLKTKLAEAEKALKS